MRSASWSRNLKMLRLAPAMTTNARLAEIEQGFPHDVTLLDTSRQFNLHLAASVLGAIPECQGSTVGLNDLPAQDDANAGAIFAWWYRTVQTDFRYPADLSLDLVPAVPNRGLLPSMTR